ncbi:MAG: hypothetical protein KF870_05550 [Leadbetterella sp.]|nr:hypothetical protein [Leadbetterella sp.]
MGRVWPKGVRRSDTKAVPPLLAYADFMNPNDRRCMETAQKIYNEFLQDKL